MSITAFKCTRPDGTDFQTGTVNYAALLGTDTALVIRVRRTRHTFTLASLAASAAIMSLRRRG